MLVARAHDIRHLGGCTCCEAPASRPRVDRRTFFTGGIGATALAGCGSVATAVAQGVLRTDAVAPTTDQGPGKPHRIDIHHHFSPPQWIAEVKGRQLLQQANADWTPARSIEDMDRGGVAAAAISITNPGLWFGDKEITHRI